MRLQRQRVVMWDLTDQSLLPEDWLALNADGISSFSAGGKYLAHGGWNWNSAKWIWDVRNVSA